MSLQMRLTCITPLICLISLLVRGAGCTPSYSPDWASLDKRPLPKWYDEAKIGIFIHWGVYSVPAFGKNSEWFLQHWQGDKNRQTVQFMEKNYRTDFKYEDFAAEFTAELFDPKSWAELFQASGARYVVFTSKHHDGFANWPSPQSQNWNSVDVGPRRDLVGDLASAVRNKSLHFGVSYSLYEWFDSVYKSDKDSKFKSQKFVDKKVIPELRDLVNRYKPELIWSNGDWEAPDTYWKSKDFLAWLYNFSPVKDEVVINDRWGKDCYCKHGGFYNCANKYMPLKALNHKWEKCQSIDKNSWGYRRDMNPSEVMDLPSIIKDLVSVVAMGGNYLLNIGPMANGQIDPLFEKRLKGLGNWLDTNGEAIYGSRPWIVQEENCNENCKNCAVWYTSKDDAVYAIIVGSKCSQLKLTKPKTTEFTKVTLLGKGDIPFDDKSTALIIDLPDEPKPPGNAWCLKLELSRVTSE